MRIVGGELGGRRLIAPPANVTRPTSDRVREGLSSALQARAAFDAGRVLDLFAGSGALGLEALSRGAGQLVAVDRDRRAVRCVEANAAELGLAERVRCLKLDLLGRGAAAVARIVETAVPTEDQGFGLIFLDPPYLHTLELVPLVAKLCEHNLVSEQGLVVIEHASRTKLPEIPPLETVANYRYGDTSIALLQLIL